MGFVFGGCFQKRRRRIDRSMIGEPTNFVHTTHVGSGDMGMGLPSVGSFLSLLLCTKSTNVSTFQSFLAAEWSKFQSPLVCS